MGEVGYDRHEYLYDLLWWEINSIVEGHYARHRQMWSATRLQAFWLMSAQIGSKGMRESGLNEPTDLIKFPWEADDEWDDDFTDEYAEEMQELIRAANAGNEEGDG